MGLDNLLIMTSLTPPFSKMEITKTLTVAVQVLVSTFKAFVTQFLFQEMILSLEEAKLV